MARDYVKDFDGKCLTCKKYDIYASGRSYATVRGFRCDRLMGPVAMTDHCYQYDKDKMRANWDIEEAVQWILKRGYDPRPSCYVVTAMCEILNISYDCEYIENFKIMRDQYMAKTEEGRNQIAAYDLYGIQIADRLRADFNNDDTRLTIENKVKTTILPSYEKVNELIKMGNLDMAVYSYFQLIKTLANHYGISYIVPIETVDKMCQQPAKIPNK